MKMVMKMKTSGFARHARPAVTGGLLIALLSAGPAKAIGLENVVRNMGEAGKEELCLVTQKAIENSEGAGFGELIKGMRDVLDSAQRQLFGNSLYCRKNLIFVVLTMGDQIDNAVHSAATSLRVAYTALGAKRKDLTDLARIQKQAIGEKFSEQAIDRTEKNIAVVNSYAERLRAEIAKKKDFLGPAARKALVEAISRFDAAVYHQTKSVIGAYLAAESIASAPKQIATLVQYGKPYGLTEDFLKKTVTRLPELLLNFGRGLEAARATNEVLDDSEKAAIEKNSRKHVEAARKRNLTVAKRIDEKSSFAGLLAADDPAGKKSASASEGGDKSSYQERAAGTASSQEKGDESNDPVGGFFKKVGGWLK